MTKRAWIEARRLEPIGAAGVEHCKAIVAGAVGGYKGMKVNEVFVDSFTASAIVAVHRGLNAANKARLESMPVVRAADLCFKLIARVNEKARAA